MIQTSTPAWPCRPAISQYLSLVKSQCMHAVVFIWFVADAYVPYHEEIYAWCPLYLTRISTAGFSKSAFWYRASALCNYCFFSRFLFFQVYLPLCCVIYKFIIDIVGLYYRNRMCLDMTDLKMVPTAYQGHVLRTVIEAKYWVWESQCCCIIMDNIFVFGTYRRRVKALFGS